ncbi:type IX secretion system membrane protein PorP/SprF [Flammeovirgaceae bacterium SG7u.111]|nr:type IX secretion system membrane protein PorP/SprF [Flammeovirgaceae bacterium SG7u.132]WPO36681.1 type IX secretion system membrane protein PorP/SprF [Flammeovirgaceae bacterium SG7u.111]
MKKLLISCLLAFFALEAMAQQDPMYTNYMFNKLVINSGYTGSKDRATAVALYRTQWTGLEGAPKTTSFSFHTPLMGWAKNVNVGISAVHDKLGISQDLDLALHAAYRLDLGVGRLGMGLSGQVRRRQMSWQSANGFQQYDPGIPANDDLVAPNFGAGLYYDMPNFYAGFSLPNLLETSYDFDQAAASTSSEAVQRRHMFFMTGGVVELSPTVKFLPSGLLKYESNSPVELDVNASVLLAETFQLGMTYRTGDAVAALVHFFFKQLRFGYSYDFGLSELNQHHSGTHEIMLGIDFGKKSKGIDHPRYF